MEKRVSYIIVSPAAAVNEQNPCFPFPSPEYKKSGFVCQLLLLSGRLIKAKGLGFKLIRLDLHGPPSCLAVVPPPPHTPFPVSTHMRATVQCQMSDRNIPKLVTAFRTGIYK